MPDLVSDRKCPRCTKTLPMTEFRVYYKSDRGPERPQVNAYCNSCDKEYGKNRVQKLIAYNLCTHCGKADAVPGKKKCSECAPRLYLNNNTANAKLRRLVLGAYGNKCVCCGEVEPKFLTLDHKNNDGAKHRDELAGGRYGSSRLGGRSRDILAWARDNNYPDTLQILCYNCNCGKERNGRLCCPHQAFATTIFVTLKPKVGIARRQEVVS